jgi:hypothetical protein
MSTKFNKKAHKARMQELFDKGNAIVQAGKCPCCGAGLALNQAMKNWWVCVHRGSPGFQKVAGPHCDFQVILPDLA